jgi:glycerol uptake facilitator-like aquaporin
MLWVFKKANGTQTAALIAMQLIGSAIAGLVLRVTFSDEVLKLAYFGTPHLTGFLTDPLRTVTLPGLLSGIGIEIGFTFLVTIAIFATLFDRRAPRLGGVVVGMAQGAVVLFGFRLTGGSANPARWFGPAMWQLTLPQSLTAAPLADHPVYWVSPVVGTLLGAFFYTVVIQPPDR